MCFLERQKPQKYFFRTQPDFGALRHIYIFIMVNGWKLEHCQIFYGSAPGPKTLPSSLTYYLEITQQCRLLKGEGGGGLFLCFSDTERVGERRRSSPPPPPDPTQVNIAARRQAMKADLLTRVLFTLNP